MREVAFRVERAELGIGVCEVVNVYVDGQPLQELVGTVEQRFANREGKPDLAGDYAGLTDRKVRWPNRHFLGEPSLSWFDDGDTVLLGCTCGDAGCWPLTARVEVGSDEVVWRDFRTGHRDWDLSDLEPLTFNRAQYEAALRTTLSD